MSIFRYLSSRKGEFLLVLISSWAVACVAMNGFFLDSITESLGYELRLLLALGIDAVLVLTLYLAAGTRGNHVSGAILVVVVAAALVLLSFSLSTGEQLYDDSEGNYLYLSLVLIFSSVGCFLLTRRLAGCMVWFVAAAFTCSLIQAFYQSGELVLSVVATLSSLSIIVYRNFSLGVQGAHLGDGKSAKFALPVAVAPVGLAALLALGTWFLVIAPLSPGVVDVKLITDYRRLPIEEFVGTSQDFPMINHDLTSDVLIDGMRYTTDDFWMDETSEFEVEATSVQRQLEALGVMGGGTGSSSGGGTQINYEEKEDDPHFDPFSYTEDRNFLLLIIALIALVIGLIVAFFVGRRVKRQKQLVAFLSKDPTQQVIGMYRFLLPRLHRIGFTQPEGMTLREFAASSARSMDVMTNETKVSFQTLTETYMKCVYGGYVPTEDEILPFVAYYLRFWHAACTYLGKPKYFFKSFRL